MSRNVSKRHLFTEDFVLEPYWWSKARPHPYDPDPALPKRADVVVVGAGVTGMEAARALASAGRTTLVLDAGQPGHGASTRSAGQIGRNFRYSYSGLKARFGKDQARSYFTELQFAYDEVKRLGDADPNAFLWRECGRCIGSMSDKLFDSLRREYEIRAGELGEVVEFLDTAQVQSEFGSELYRGGILLPNNGAIHPGLYFNYLERRTLQAGPNVLAFTPVQAIEPEKSGFRVTTTRGVVFCKDVLVATNGYTPKSFRQFRRRLLPLSSYIVATEELTDEQMRSTLRGLRTYGDNRRRNDYFSVAGDGNRILLGGRTGSYVTNMTALSHALAEDLVYILPQLEGVRISHGWRGECAGAYDLFPRFGKLDGLYYAMGYCFSGMALGPHLGRKVAAMMTGDAEARQSNFYRDTFPVYPAATRGPWTMPLLTGWYAWKDRPRTLTRRI